MDPHDTATTEPPVPPDMQRLIRSRTRRRFVFTGLVVALYFSFVINWTGLGTALRRPLGDSEVSGSLLMFVLLLLTFVVLEALFLRLQGGEQPGND